MKKNLFFCLIAFASLLSNINSYATTHMVTVQDFSFSPSTMSVTVGDTVMWMWVSGTHTTTSLSVPAGAASWNSNINSAESFFAYPVTVAGTYSYDCSIHPTLMSGSFTATGSVGISPVTSSSGLMLNSTLVSDELQVTYKLEIPTSVQILLLDLSGKQIDNLSFSSQFPGAYSEKLFLNQLAKGEYVLQLRTDNMIASRKIVVE